MRKLLAFMIPFALSAACAATDVPQPGHPVTRTATASRIVLISLDGLAAVRHRENLADRVYTDQDGLTAFERTGYVVERAIPVDPPVTSPSHASIATGAFPAVTGIVANWFHVPGTPIRQGVTGFAHPWAAESLWQAFHRQGKRVGVLTYPGCDDTVPSRTADFGMVYVNRPSAPAVSLTLSAGQFEATTVPAGWTSYSPPRRTTTSVVLETAGAPTTVTFTLTAIDTTDDRTIDYDTLVADNDSDLGNGTLGRARAGQWFPLLVHLPHPDGGTRVVGAWCLVQALAPDLSTVKVYRGAFFSTEAYPPAFRERLDESAGFWPGPGDERAMVRARAGRDGLSISEFMEQEKRFSEFFNACTRTAIASERFDLLLAYQPTVDEVEHVLLVVDPRQTAYSKSFAAIARDAITEAYRIADHAVGELARELDLGHDALVVVSDHGMAPVWETVSVNQILQQAGLAEGELTARGWRVTTTSKVVAFGSGGCLNLYVNLKGREPSGVVESADEAGVVQSAAVALAAAQVDGEDIVEAMYPHKRLAAIGMNSPNAGDLVVFLRPGFMGTATIGAAGTPFHAPAELAGQHGFANTHREMAAIWLARGAGVTKRHTATASLTGVAAFVAHLAGVQPPAQAHPWTP
jgi:predicted AlkP superfamily phosphohydrolase/phosphomutase